MMPIPELDDTEVPYGYLHDETYSNSAASVVAIEAPTLPFADPSWSATFSHDTAAFIKRQ